MMRCKGSVFTRAVTALPALLGPLVASTMWSGGTATAAPAGPPPKVPITLRSDGFSIAGPNPRPGGYVTFDVNTDVPDGRWMSLMRPQPGVSLDQVLKDFNDAASPDPAVAMPALRAEYRDTDFLGGTSVFPGSPVSLTQRLSEGRYYFVDTSPSGDTTIQTLDVTMETVPATPPRPHGFVQFVGRDTPRILAPARLPANGTIRFGNTYTMPEEMIFVPTTPDATHASIQAYFEAQLAGKPLPPNPFAGPSGGALAISPGRTAIVRLHLPPGHYSVLSFLLDPDTGVKQAYLGLHKELVLYGE